VGKTHCNFYYLFIIRKEQSTEYKERVRNSLKEEKKKRKE
jgi:hypothetical protein